MAEVNVHFDFKLGPERLRWILACVFVLAAAPELDSETVTLSTYYPAPSGVYVNMITTDNTYLARDGGNVGINTTTLNNRLNVSGNASVSGSLGVGMTSVPGVALDVAQNLTARVGRAYLSSGGDYMHLSNNEYYNGGAWQYPGGASAGVLLQFSGQTATFYRHNGGGAHSTSMSIDPSGNVAMNANSSVAGNETITGNSTVGGTLGVTGRATMSSDARINYYVAPGVTTAGTCRAVNAAPNTTVCNAGEYATSSAGVYARYSLAPVLITGNYQSSPSITISVLCCSYASGGVVF